MTTAFGHLHAEALHNGREIDFYEKHQTIEVSRQNVGWKFAS